MDYEYKVECFQEGALSSMFLGNANTKLKYMEKKLNKLGVVGWRVVSVEKETQRLYLFWKREAMIVIFIRPIPKG